MGTLIAFTVGLLAFLAIDAGLEGLEIAAEAPAAFGGTTLVLVGGLVAYLALAGIDSYLLAALAAGRGRGSGWSRCQLPGAPGRDRDRPAQPRRGAGDRLRLRQRRPRARGLPRRRLRDPQHHRGAGDRRPAARRRPGRRPARLLALGLIAGAPAILGAWIGAAAFNPSLAALLFGVGVGAIARVIVQLAPAMRDPDGRYLYPASVAWDARRHRRPLSHRPAGVGLMAAEGGRSARAERPAPRRSRTTRRRSTRSPPNARGWC